MNSNRLSTHTADGARKIGFGPEYLQLLHNRVITATIRVVMGRRVRPYVGEPVSLIVTDHDEVARGFVEWTSRVRLGNVTPTTRERAGAEFSTPIKSAAALQRYYQRYGQVITDDTLVEVIHFGYVGTRSGRQSYGFEPEPRASEWMDPPAGYERHAYRDY